MHVVHGPHLVTPTQVRGQDVSTESYTIQLVIIVKNGCLPDIVPDGGDITRVEDDIVPDTITEEWSEHREEHVENPEI